VRRILKRSAKFAWRMGVLVVGMFLLIVGIIMIFTPGPAIVFIPAGLAVLATEFQWARRLLHRVRPLIEKAVEKAKQKKESVAQRRADKQAAKPPVATGRGIMPAGRHLVKRRVAPSTRKN
jgi:uncharacterized protein (TIGR02611 family)